VLLSAPPLNMAASFEAAWPHLRRLCLFMGGALGTALLSYALLGWPNAAWYRIALRILPRYHADSTGFAYPIPYVGNKMLPTHEPAQVIAAIGIVLVCLVMLAVVARDLVAGRSGKTPRSFLEKPFPVLLVFLAALTLKSAFGRSDSAHIGYSATVIFLILALFAARAFVQSTLPRRAKVLLIIVLFSGFHFAEGSFSTKPLISGWSIKTFGQLADIYGDYAHPQPPPRDCSGGLLSPLQARVYEDLERRLCETRKVLADYDLKGKDLLIGHGAALLYPMLGFELPTQYYLLGWAITDEMQEQLVAELERSAVKAVLRADKYGMPEYDIPDSVRLPRYFRWLTQNFDVENPIVTPLGELYLRKESTLPGWKRPVPKDVDFTP
jgi:hypothetical protein